MNDFLPALLILKDQTVTFYNFLGDIYKSYYNSITELMGNQQFYLPSYNHELSKLYGVQNTITEQRTQLIELNQTIDILFAGYQNNSICDNENNTKRINEINKQLGSLMGKYKYDDFRVTGEFAKVLAQAISDIESMAKSSNNNMGYISSETKIVPVAEPKKIKVRQLEKEDCVQDDNGVEAIYAHELQSILDLNNNPKQLEIKELVVGNNYYIENSFDKTMINKVYELKHIVFKKNIKYLVVKKAKGFDFPIFTLSSTLCEYLNIPFEEGLTVMPDNYDWKQYYRPMVENLEFNPKDLSTYPTQEGYINFIIVKLSGFQSLRKHHLATPNKTEIDPQTFLKSFRVTFKYDLDGEKNNIITTSKKIGWDLLTFEDDDITRQGCICDKDGNIFLKLDLRGFEITPSMACGLSAADVFKFSWVEEKVVEREIEERPTVRKQQPSRQDLFTKVFGNDFYDEDAQWNKEVDEIIKPQNGMVRVNPTPRGIMYEVYVDNRWVSMTKEQFESAKRRGYIKPIDPTNL